jgi:tol-pal system protein YbgF
VIRRALIAVLPLSLTLPALAANKDQERLQMQVVGLQGQINDLQRVMEDHLKELKRLNEALAEQNAMVKRATQDQRTQDEALQNAIRELTERLGEVRERLQAAAPPAYPGTQPAPEGGQGAPGVPYPAGPSGAAGAQPSPSGPPPAPRELYSQAYADYARGNYDLAIQGFQEYLKNYPSTDFSDNAQYWIGECLYGKQKYGEAIEAWNTLLRDFPSSDKLPDARVKKGMSLERLGRRSQALTEYRYVVDRYPNTQAARIARDKLNPQ